MVLPKIIYMFFYYYYYLVDLWLLHMHMLDVPPKSTRGHSNMFRFEEDFGQGGLMCTTRPSYLFNLLRINFN